MKASNAIQFPPLVFSPPSPRDRTAKAERFHKSSVEALFARASRGDRNAVTAIYVSYRWVILREAAAVLGPYAQDAEDVAHELVVLLLEGALPYTPSHGTPGGWLRFMVRTIARQWRADRERKWEGPEE